MNTEVINIWKCGGDIAVVNRLFEAVKSVFPHVDGFERWQYLANCWVNEQIGNIVGRVTFSAACKVPPEICHDFDAVPPISEMNISVKDHRIAVIQWETNKSVKVLIDACGWPRYGF